MTDGCALGRTVTCHLQLARSPALHTHGAVGGLGALPGKLGAADSWGTQMTTSRVTACRAPWNLGGSGHPWLTPSPRFLPCPARPAPSCP